MNERSCCHLSTLLIKNLVHKYTGRSYYQLSHLLYLRIKLMRNQKFMWHCTIPPHYKNDANGEKIAMKICEENPSGIYQVWVDYKQEKLRYSCMHYLGKNQTWKFTN